MKEKELIINIISKLLGEDEIESIDDSLIEESIELLNNHTDAITLRLHAEYDNKRKQSESRQIIIDNQKKFETISGLIDVLDDFQFFESTISDSGDTSIKIGYDLLYKKLMDSLTEMGVSVINTDVPFDSDIHECISVLDEGKEKDTILSVISKGYMMGEHIVRYPKVIVQS